MPSEIPPCSRCGAGRPLNVEAIVEVDPALVALIMQRIESGGMCLDCARNDVDAAVVKGLVHPQRGETVKGATPWQISRR